MAADISEASGEGFAVAVGDSRQDAREGDPCDVPVTDRRATAADDASASGAGASGEPSSCGVRCAVAGSGRADEAAGDPEKIATENEYSSASPGRPARLSGGGRSRSPADGLTGDLSVAALLARLPTARRRELLAAFGPAEREALRWTWPFWARPSQRAPAGDWRTWLILAGRGFGKTRAGAEWVRAMAERDGSARIALVAATMAEARAVMVEGESGLLNIAPPGLRPEWEPSLRRLRWPGGAVAFLYSAAEPDSLRGPEHHYAWADEIAKWPDGEAAWTNLALGLRLGRRPRAVATTTPRPVKLLRRLLAEEGVAVTRGRTIDNRSHLPPGFIAAMEAAYAGTRIGRQELDGELIEDVPGALWSRTLIEACRAGALPELRRVVVAVDPPAGAAGSGGDACGIVAAALGGDGHAYVLADASVGGLGPEGWARAVAQTAERYGADRVVAEANNGGAMVESVLRAADAGLPVRLVHASRGKSARAEPVATLYEAGKVRHADSFPELEDQLVGMMAGGGYEGPGRSPDRADALVWALTELMLKQAGRPGVRLL